MYRCCVVVHIAYPSRSVTPSSRSWISLVPAMVEVLLLKVSRGALLAVGVVVLVLSSVGVCMWIGRWVWRVLVGCLWWPSCLSWRMAAACSTTACIAGSGSLFLSLKIS